MLSGRRTRPRQTFAYYWSSTPAGSARVRGLPPRQKLSHGGAVWTMMRMLTNGDTDEPSVTIRNELLGSLHDEVDALITHIKGKGRGPATVGVQ